MPRIYVYKLVADGNGAPHITGEQLSLAICKPQIRRTAREGDLLFGFAANGLHRDNRLIYAARVTETVEREYYTGTRFDGRGDCIYRWNDVRFEIRPGALHHGPQHLEHDLGPHPDYPRARVLVSDDFRYFGGDGTDEYKRRYPLVKYAVETLRRGHLVNHPQPLSDELLELKQELWRRHRRKVLGQPSSEPRVAERPRAQSHACPSPLPARED